MNFIYIVEKYTANSLGYFNVNKFFSVYKEVMKSKKEDEGLVKRKGHAEIITSSQPIIPKGFMYATWLGYP